jgi:tetratricopeptide repeat protein 21B
MRAFREAAKKDPDSVLALLGMIRCQLLEGQHEDAEAQIELLTVMHNAEDLGAEFALIQAMLARQGASKDSKKHLNLLNQCQDVFDNKRLRSQCTPIWSSPDELLEDYVTSSADFFMCLAVEYLTHIESAISVNIFSSVRGSGGGGANGDEDTVDSNPMLSASSSASGAEISPPVQQGIDLLRKVITLCPGFICTYIELARAYSTLGMHEEAVRVLHQCLSMQPNCTGALVAMAKVEIARTNTSAADRALEQALSCDFTIRSVTLFRLARVMVMTQQGKLDEAIAEMEQVIRLPDIAQTSTGVSSPDAPAMIDSLGAGFGSGSSSNAAPYTPSMQSANSFADSFRLLDDDRVGAYATLAGLYGKAKRSKEAHKVLSDAKVMFAGTPQEVLVLVAASQLAVEKNDFDSAVRMLDKISDDSPTFVKAQLIKAEILLNHNRDQEGYTQCFHQLGKFTMEFRYYFTCWFLFGVGFVVDREPSAKNYTLLGEAYLKILNPEKAVEAFEAAHKMDCTNARLRVRIGRTLVATHEYHRAIDFYEQAIKQSLQENTRGGGGSGMGGGKSSESINLSHDLARLFAKLDRSEHAIRVLTRATHESYRDLTDYKQNVSTMLLLTDVYKKNNPAEVLNALKTACELQKSVIMQVRSGGSIVNNETVEAEKSLLSNICERIGAYYVANNENQAAEEYFHEALQQNLQNTKAMFGIATLCRNRNDIEQCQMHCRKIISADPSHEQATVMLSETIFLGPEPDTAVEPLQNLLRAHPNNYRALERLISLLRRAGKLEEVPTFLSAASYADRRSGSHAGFRFCSGLYARFTNDIGKVSDCCSFSRMPSLLTQKIALLLRVQAISEFNLARKDDSWGPLALTHMIELYLNPDQEGAWEERETGPIDENTSENIAVAEALIKELKPKARYVYSVVCVSGITNGVIMAVSLLGLVIR